MAGIIPALAGNTSQPCLMAFSCRDHPRACGEHLLRRRLRSVFGGSSPRLRGTPHCFRVDAQTSGIIPALAGNTEAPAARLQCAWDHPRACGEHRTIDPKAFTAMGSSPRLRGTLKVAARHFDTTGIIPALAGNTTCSADVGRQDRDHPRACGEHETVRMWRATALGSSPRLRGTLFISFLPSRL